MAFREVFMFTIPDSRRQCEKCGDLGRLRQTKSKVDRRWLCGDCRNEIEKRILRLRKQIESRRKRIALIIFERDGYRCVECGATEQLTIDHKISLIDGGTNDLTNLQTLCAHHNFCKH